MKIVKKIFTEEEIELDSIKEDVIFILKEDGKISLKTASIYRKCLQDNIPLFYIVNSDRIEDNDLKKLGIKLIPNERPNNLQELKNSVDKGANGIWLSEENELSFRIKDIACFLHNRENPVSLIVTINSGQEDFFIRPEDIVYYEMFLDFGFLMTTKNERQIIEAYQQRSWNGLLSDIVINKECTPIVTNKGFFKTFGINRVNCGKKCLLGKCKLCADAYSANTLVSNLGLEIKELPLDFK